MFSTEFPFDYRLRYFVLTEDVLLVEATPVARMPVVQLHVGDILISDLSDCLLLDDFWEKLPETHVDAFWRSKSTCPGCVSANWFSYQPIQNSVYDVTETVALLCDIDGNFQSRSMMLC